MRIYKYKKSMVSYIDDIIYAIMCVYWNHLLHTITRQPYHIIIVSHIINALYNILYRVYNTILIL